MFNFLKGRRKKKEESISDDDIKKFILSKLKSNISTYGCDRNEKLKLAYFRRVNNCDVWFWISHKDIMEKFKNVSLIRIEACIEKDFTGFMKEAEAYLIKSLGKTLSEVALGYDTYVNINRKAKYCDFIAIGLKVILK